MMSLYENMSGGERWLFNSMDRENWSQQVKSLENVSSGAIPAGWSFP